MGDVHNAIKYDTGLANAVGVGAGLSRDQGGLERISETLQPSVDVYTLPEWQLLRGNWLAAMDGAQGVVAGEFSCVAFINSAGSGVLAVVTSITCQDLTASNDFALELVTGESVIRAALAGVEVRGLYRDRRRPNISARCSVLVGSEAAAVGGEIETLAAAGAPQAESRAVPIIVPPGQGIVLRSLVLAQSIRASFAWYERQALPGELTVL